MTFFLFKLFKVKACLLIFWCEMLCYFIILLSSIRMQNQNLLTSALPACRANETIVSDDSCWGFPCLLLACMSRIGPSPRQASVWAVTCCCPGIEPPRWSAALQLSGYRGWVVKLGCFSPSDEGLQTSVWMDYAPLAPSSAQIPKFFSKESLVCASPRTDDWGGFLCG